MSRDSSGNYTLPPGVNPVVDGTVIETDWANQTLDDLSGEVTDSLSRSGKGAMLAQFKAFAGTKLAPGWSWGLELTSGFYRFGAGDIRFAMANSDIMIITSAGIQITALTVNSLTTTGTVAAATFQVDANYTFALNTGNPRITVDTNDYLSYNRATNQWMVFIGGVQVLIIQSDGRVTSAVAASAGSDFMRKTEVDAATSALTTSVNTAQSTANGAVSTINNFINRFVGAVQAFPVSAVPTGWLECTGQAVSRSTYSQLFTLLGTTYGPGDGATTFNVPDYRGFFLRGWDHGAGRDPDAAGRGAISPSAIAGDNPGSGQTSALQQHTHNTFVPSWDATASRDGDPPYATDNPGAISASAGVNAPVPTSTETRPLNRYVMYCIFANA